MKKWGIEYCEPLIISGPCSAESQEQMLETAEKLAQMNIKIFRAGAWKPRTRPNVYEGSGIKGLEWLREVKKRTGMYVATEVANEKHIFEALKYDIDILWLGARTTANPFAVQEIADVLRGIDIPVFVKNPVNPDINLWIGALERLNNAGITKLAAIHRGFSSYEKTNYRNNPQWEIPVELKIKISGLPVICDPSHICGNRELLQDVAQKAFDLDFDGLMIESHCNPESALSDAQQQITPEQLNVLLKNLTLRKKDSKDISYKKTIDEIRKNIDNMDNQILNILAKRMECAEMIGHFKKLNKITVLQSGRWEEILENARVKGNKLKLSTAFIDDLFKAIHQESINHQLEIINNKKELNILF